MQDAIFGPPQAKKSWVRAPYRENGFLLARSLPFASSPISGIQRPSPFGPPSANAARRVLPRARRGRGRLWRLLAGLPRLSPGTTLLLPFFLRRFRGALRTDERVGPGPEICPSHALPIALQREENHAGGFSEAVPPSLLSLSLSGGYLAPVRGVFYTSAGNCCYPLPGEAIPEKNASASPFCTRAPNCAPPIGEVWNGTAKRAHLQVALLAERHVPIKLYAALQRK